MRVRRIRESSPNESQSDSHSDFEERSFMKYFVLCIACLLFASSFAHGQTAVITPTDLQILEGPKWTGTLTYLDYRSNKRTSIKSNLKVTRKAEDPAIWTFAYEYPDEPNANDVSDAVLEDGGTKFFGETVIEKKFLAGKTLRLVTTQTGTDNGKKAVFRYTYLINAKSLSIKKEVQVAGSSDWFERNEYLWVR
jgi:hypothetical protein